MVSRRAGRGIAALACVAGACQSIAGVGDKELDPKLSATDSGVGEAGWDASTNLDGWSAVPPDRPAGPAVPSGKGVKRHFAARKIYLGTVDPSTNQPDNKAWKKIGHAIDGETTTLDISISDASKTCKRPPSAADGSLEDGNDGRDNAGGRLVAFGADFLSKDFEISLHAKVNSGNSPTFVLVLDDLDSGADDPYVPGTILVTVPTPGQPPLWNGSDEPWIDRTTVELPVDGGAEAGAADASDDGSVEAATEAAAPPASGIIGRYRFPDGYMKGNVWVSGDLGKTPMKFPMFVLDRIAVVTAATVTLAVELKPTHDGVVRSMLSAAATQETLQTEFYPIALEIVPLCNAALANLFMDQFLKPGMDLANNPPKFEISSGAACDTLSFGFAFEWVLVKEPKVVTDNPNMPKCSP